MANLAGAREPAGDARSSVRPVLRPLAWLFWVATGLVIVAAIQLFILTTRTGRFFAWTIAEPLTAAIDGAFYLSTCIVLVACARARAWTVARPVAWGVLTISAGKLAATLIHRSAFHFTTGPATARIAAWGWLVIYALVPLALLALIPAQVRAPCGELPPTSRFGSVIRTATAVIAVVLLAIGLALFFVPGRMTPHWPWPLTTLTARDLAAWFAGTGVVGALAVAHDDPAASRHIWVGSVALAFLQAVALLRYPHDFRWGSAPGMLYVALLVVIAVAGALAWRSGAPDALESRPQSAAAATADPRSR